MKKNFCLLLVFTMAIPVFAQFQINVVGQAPTVGGTNANLINPALANAFNSVISELNAQYKDLFPKSPDKFLRAMSNSSVYASHGATTRGYGGYKIFSATVGPTVGFQLPSGIGAFMNDLDGLSDSLEREGDINLGYAINMMNVNVGINMGVFKFLPEHLGVLKRDNLYVGLRAGYFRLPNLSDLSFNSLTLGVTANYQLIPTVGLSLLKWRGVNIGTGFIYNSNKIGFSMPLGDFISEPIAGGFGTIQMKPVTSVKLDVSTYTIPLEVVTAVKLLIFNIPFGIGADLAFGKTSLGLGVDSNVTISGLPAGAYQASPGVISVSANAKSSPSVFNFKIMTGLGLSMGPVVIDFPFTYYPANYSYTLGLTLGAVL